MAKEKIEKRMLTADELVLYQFNLDSVNIQIENSEFHIKQANKALELGLPQRSAAQEIKKMEEDLKRSKLNKKFFMNAVRDKSVEIPGQ